MSWVRIDDGIADHPKVLAAGAKLGPDGAAIILGMMVWALAYAARYLTDGELPRQAVETCSRISDRNAVTNALVTNGLWEKTATGWRIHDYDQYQEAAETVRERRQRAAQRQQAWREKHRQDKQLAQTVTKKRNAVTNASVTASSRARVPIPIPIPTNVRTADAIASAADTDQTEDGKALEKGAIKRFSDAFLALYAEHHAGAKYRWLGAKDTKLAKQLLGLYGHDRLLELARGLQTSDDDWISGTDRGIGILAAKASWLDQRLSEWQAAHGRCDADAG